MHFTESPRFIALSPIERVVALGLVGWDISILHTGSRIAAALADGTLDPATTTVDEVHAAIPDWRVDPRWSETAIALAGVRGIDDFYIDAPDEFIETFGTHGTWTHFPEHFETAGVTPEEFWTAVHPLSIPERAALFVRAAGS